MSLRARLIRILFATLVPLGLVVGIGLYAFVRLTLTARLDDGLAARIESLAAATKSRAGAVEFDAEDADIPQYKSGKSPETAYFEVWQLAVGNLARLVGHSESLGDRRLLQPGAGAGAGGGWSADLEGDVDVRVMARRFVPEAEDVKADRSSMTDVGPPPLPEAMIVVAVLSEPVDGPMRALAVGLLSAGVVFVVAGGVAIRWALSRALSPVRDLAERVRGIDPSKPEVRLETADLPREIVPIQERLNELLGRIDAAMKREKRFTAAAAHELRTPVAELRTLLEVAASRERSAEEANDVIATSLTSIERLHNLVVALLRLTRIEAGRERANLAPTLIAEVVQSAINMADPLARSRRVTFSAQVLGGATVLADRDLLTLGLTNLIGNAAEYADRGSQVDVTLKTVGAATVLRIENAASDLGEGARQVGEPLWSSDAARTGTAHVGLGITLARAALTACDAETDVQAQPGASARFIVEVRFRS